MSTIAQHAKAIFLQAVEKHSPHRWPEFLDEACGDDQELRQRVEGLLQAHQDKDSLFDQVPPTRGHEPCEQVGQMIGPYKLRECLGEGGMGVVWGAEQKQPLRRKVALKVIKPGMDSAAIIARFDLEREALALMDHSNIARVLDAGTTPRGRPYFVMELIRGVPITEYCDAHKLSIPDRLQLFAQVCSAVQHAHQKGIVHRDIKPLNVLVTEKDGQPVPKVIDFGVAKALHQPLTDQSVYSGLFQAIGTMVYMSPEQAGLSSTDVDSRADVYGLGVLLYELLTGTTPFNKDELASAALDEACRIIREKDPLKPSVTISTLGERAASVSEGRGTNPISLGKVVKGELDWIVMKALEKDRDRRYDSASSLTDDIGRYLAGDPVSVSPPSQVYRLSRFCRRNTGKIVVGVLFAASLLIGTVVSMTLAVRWARESERNAALANALRNEQDNLVTTANQLHASNVELKRSRDAQARVSYSRAMMAAYMEWANANPVAVVDLLKETRSYEESLGLDAGIEWNLLCNQVHRDFADYAGTTLAHTSPFVNIAFSADGRKLAVPIPDAGVFVFDLLTNDQEQLTFPLEESSEWSQPVAAAFCPTGRLAVGIKTGKDEGRVNILGEERETVHAIKVDFEPWRLKFSLDGKHLEAGSAYPALKRTEGMLTIWSVPETESDERTQASRSSEDRPPLVAYRRSRRAVDLHEEESGKFIRQVVESVSLRQRHGTLLVDEPTCETVAVIALWPFARAWRRGVH